MRTRRSWRNQDRLHKAMSRELWLKALAEAKEPALAALRLCLAEIEQFHSTAYPECQGGCPAHEAMTAARAVLGAPKQGR